MEKYKQPTLIKELKAFDAVYHEYPKAYGKRLDGREDALYLAFHRLKKSNFKKITDPEELKFLKEYFLKYSK